MRQISFNIARFRAPPLRGDVLPLTTEKLPRPSHVSVIWRRVLTRDNGTEAGCRLDRMLLLSNRIRLCSLAFTAARMYSSGAAAANKNPTVYFDIAADGQPLGRVTFEVRRHRYHRDGLLFIPSHSCTPVGKETPADSRWFCFPHFCRCLCRSVQITYSKVHHVHVWPWGVSFYFFLLLQLNADVVPKTAGNPSVLW